VEDREADESEIKADVIVVPTVNMGCGMVVSKPALQAIGTGLTTLVIICIVIAIIVLSFTIHPTDPRQKSISNLKSTLSAECALSDPYSPQSQSEEWILGVDNKNSDPIQDQLLLKQRYALSTIIYSLGNSSNITTSHLGSAPECQWNSQGIQCNDDQWITGLNFFKSKMLMHFANMRLSLYIILHLAFMGLRGLIESEKAYLSYLETVDFSNNQLSSTILAYIGLL